MAPDRRRLLALGLLAPLASPATLRAQPTTAEPPAAEPPAAPATAEPPATPPAAEPPASPPAQAAAPPAADPRLAERSIGRAGAPVAVTEFFDLTCSHCANFHRRTWPQVKAELVETGRIRFILQPWPLNLVGLEAAVVALHLPPERFDAFVGTLLTAQDRWAYARDPKAELARYAALAGMPRAQFDAALADEPFKRLLIERRQAAALQYQIESTPTFVIGTRVVRGDTDFATFKREVEAATPR